MAARSGVVDTSVLKGITDLHAGVVSDDPVVAPAHEVVQDSDLIADSSIHSDAAPDHGGDTAMSAEDAPAAHADLAYADADHVVADQGIADVDHAYADHSYADASVPDSVFAAHSIMPADDGTPHSLGAGQGQDDSHDAAAWWWVGGAALAAGGLGYWAGHDHNDNNDSSSTTVPAADVHVVVERGDASDGPVVDTLFIDDNANGVHDTNELTVADFGIGGNADLAANHVTVHFNDVPLEPINLTGFGEDDKIEFHIEAMINNGIVTNQGSVSVIAQHLSGMVIDPGHPAVTYTLAGTDGANGVRFELHQHDTTSLTDFNGHGWDYAMNNGLLDPLGGYLRADNLATHILGNQIGFTADGASVTFSFSMNSGAIAYWSDTDNALNHNSLLVPNYVMGTLFTGTNTTGNSSVIRDNVNANNEGHLVDFIWPSGAPVIPG
jgi:hypothetical protein